MGPAHDAIDDFIIIKLRTGFSCDELAPDRFLPVLILGELLHQLMLRSSLQVALLALSISPITPVRIVPPGWRICSPESAPTATVFSLFRRGEKPRDPETALILFP